MFGLLMQVSSLLYRPQRGNGLGSHKLGWRAFCLSCVLHAKIQILHCKLPHAVRFGQLRHDPTLSCSGASNGRLSDPSN